MIPFGGTSANLAVDAELRAAVEEAAATSLRAVKVVVDSKGERLIVGGTVAEVSTLAEDFLAVAALLEDAAPCLVLVRLDEASWAIVAWTPDDAPVRLRMLCASSRKTLRDEFKRFRFKEYNVTERAEVTLAQFEEQTRELTDSDRRAAMTNAEIDAAEAKMAAAQEQKTAPKMLAGLVAVQIQAQASFEDSVRRLSAEENKAVLGRLAGDKGEQLIGEVLDEISGPPQLQGKLPADEPCYVLLRLEEGRLLLLSWLPDGANVKAKMKFSTFKASVLHLVKELANGSTVAQKEITDEDDLAEDLGAAPAAVAGEGEAAQADSGSSGGGFKPPPGAMALPGMGKPPPGGMALPGMGPGMLRPRP